MVIQTPAGMERGQRQAFDPKYSILEKTKTIRGISTMKQLPALFAALVITGLIGFAMLSIGTNALVNNNALPISQSPGSTAVVDNATTQDPTQDPNQAQIKQMQDLVTQYQARDQQYQAQLNDAVQKLNDENAQLQQYQRLLAELQRRGIILVQSEGTVLLPGR
jgi:hypothetical protein